MAAAEATGRIVCLDAAVYIAIPAMAVPPRPDSPPPLSTGVLFIGCLAPREIGSIHFETLRHGDTVKVRPLAYYVRRQVSYEEWLATNPGPRSLNHQRMPYYYEISSD